MAFKKVNKSSPFYIAAIGASAGGLGALQKILSHLPADIEHIAFVVAQHLSPSYKSMLAETLRNYTSLDVIEVKNSAVVKENNIYITPPNCEIIIRNGKLRLSHPARTSAARPSIDNLFISLAKEMKTHAIGIVLSGTGADGAKGIQAIKAAGGITFAQDPASAKYNSMPLAAIETAKVDYILPSEKIGPVLHQITSNGTGILSTKTVDAAGNDLAEIIEVLSEKTGTDFTNYKQNTLFRRISRRLTQLKIDTPRHYLEYIKQNPEEADELFYTTLIGVTSFFRDPAVFKALEKILLAVINAKTGHDALRVWIVGCATGEEAYSVAILIAMLQKEKQKHQPVQIIATDVNEHSLNVARKGIYAKRNLQLVPAEMVKQYFTPQNGHYEISKSIRSMVLFSRHDITNNPPFLKLDLIVCRNLLIYFNSKLQNHVFPVFHSALQPNGYLLLGKSESVGHFTNLFSLAHRSAKIYQRKGVSYLPKVHFSPFKPNGKPLTASKPEKTIADMARETIFRVFEWPYVVINDNMELQEIHGDVSRYLGLKPGQMNANLIKLAHKDLKIELRSLVNKCITGKKETRGLAKKIETAGKEQFVKINVHPLVFSEQPDDFYLVVFEEIKAVGAGVKHSFIPSGKNDARKIEELEKELEALKEDLQVFIDRLENSNADLQSANEELQAANEELKISNEELETANEELQSANEEINIAYTELKAANEALEIHDAALRKSEANVNALLSNTLQAFILLDAEYRIMAFNNIAHKTFKNIFGKKIEVGDSIAHLISSDLAGYFTGEIEEALKGKIIIAEKLIKTSSGKSYGFIISCTPVLDADKKVQALSFSMLDITELKKTKSELIKSQELISSVFHTADIGLAVLNEKGRYIKTNDGYNKLFGYNAGELEGKHYAVSIPPGNKKKSLNLFKNILAGKYSNEERLAIKKNGEIFTVFRTVKLLKNADGSYNVVLTARDISETNRYRNLLLNTEKNLHIAGWETDIITGKLTCTDELYNIIEMNEADFNKLPPKQKLQKFLEPAMRPVMQHALEEAIRKGKAFDFETPLKTTAKKMKWVRITGAAVQVKSHTVKLGGTLQDITQKKEAELQLERLSLVASKTNNAVFITDAFGKTVWVNGSVERLTGYTSSELLGKTPGALLQGKETDKETVRRIKDRLKKQLPVSEIIANYRKDGTPYWINLDIAPVFKDNRLVNFIGIGVDITEIIMAREDKKIKDTLEQQQKLFNAVAKNFPNGIIGLLDKDYHYIFAGGAEIKKLNLTVEDLIGNHIFDHLSDKSNMDAEPFLNKALVGENIIFEAEIKGETYAINAVPVSVGGDTEGRMILVVMQNITNRKKAEKDLIETVKKEKELGELKSRFVTMASHEFRTPLSTVLSSAYLIEKYASADEQSQREKHLHRIVSSVEMLTEILNDFLSLGKIEEGKIQVKRTEFNIRELVTAITREMKNNLKEQQQIIYHHEGHPVVLMDASLLKHIIMNLVSNASKFSPEGKPIEIKTICQKKHMTLAVKDYGMGIPKEDQAHLMERFFRGGNASNIKGTGLGLHIVSKYAELMDGTIECKSELEKGTEFILTFTTKAS